MGQNTFHQDLDTLLDKVIAAQATLDKGNKDLLDAKAKITQALLDKHRGEWPVGYAIGYRKSKELGEPVTDLMAQIDNTIEQNRQESAERLSQLEQARFEIEQEINDLIYTEEVKLLQDELDVRISTSPVKEKAYLILKKKSYSHK